MSTSDPLWTVTCEPGAALPPIQQALQAAGLDVVQVLDMIGVIQGHCPAAALPRLQAVPGVADVAPTLGFQLGAEEG